MIGGVAEHLVDDDPDAVPVRFLEQGVEVLQRAEQRIDFAIAAYVIAEILHRRLEEGGDPDRVDTERPDVVHSSGDAPQIARSAAVAVLEAARIDLVDHGVAPPVAHGGVLPNARPACPNARPAPGKAKPPLANAQPAPPTRDPPTRLSTVP